MESDPFDERHDADMPSEKLLIDWSEHNARADQIDYGVHYKRDELFGEEDVEEIKFQEVERLGRDLEELIVRFGEGTLEGAGVYATCAGGAQVIDPARPNAGQYRLTLIGPLGDDKEDALG